MCRILKLCRPHILVNFGNNSTQHVGIGIRTTSDMLNGERREHRGTGGIVKCIVFLPRAPYVGLPLMAHARTSSIVARIGLLVVSLLGASSPQMSVVYVYPLTAAELVLVAGITYSIWTFHYSTSSAVQVVHQTIACVRIFDS